MPEAVITKTLVPESQRLDVLPRYFSGRYLMIADSTVFGCMEEYVEQYSGGYWDFFSLSNGGFYMVPRMSEQMVDVVAPNQYSGKMSVDAAALVACLYGFGKLCSASEEDAAIELYHQVRDYARQHPEAQEILRAID